MKNLIKNITISALLALVAHLLMQGNHGAFFVPFAIWVLGAAGSYIAYDTKKQQQQA